MPSFSIITPNLNQGSYLHNNLTSVSQQSYDQVEHIVLDCNSSDNSLEVLRGFNHKKRFLSIQDNDLGQSDALNKGLQMSTGEYLAWLNSDDRYVDDSVLVQVASIFSNNPDVDVVYGRGEYVEEGTNSKKTAWIQEDAAKFSVSLVSTVGLIQPSVFFRRSLIARVGLLDVSNQYSMDYDLWIRFALAGAKFYFLDSLLSRAILHDQGKSVAARTSQLEETVAVCAKHYGFAHPRWITAYARSAVLGDTSFLNEQQDQITSEQQQEIASIERVYFRKYNSSTDSVNKLRLLAPDIADIYLTKHYPSLGHHAASSRSQATLDNTQTCDICLYPCIDSLADYFDQLERIRWYVPASSGILVRLLVTEPLRLQLVDLADQSAIPANLSLTQMPASHDERARLLASSRTIGIWRDFGKYSPDCAGFDTVRLFNLDKHHEARREAFQSSVLLHELDWPYRELAKKELTKKSKEFFSEYSKRDKAYLFCTGPSVAEADKYTYDDGYTIVCNSIVGNDKLMERLRPDFIVAADPVFHYGSSDYAFEFRDRLHQAVAKYDSKLLVPFFYYPLFARNCPELVERTLGVMQDPSQPYNFDLVDNLSVKGADNILTLLMIPLGATIADNLVVLGCDGRKPEETYFWKHDPSSQFDALMQSAREHHPAFFNHVDYADYYEEHCTNLANMIDDLESMGKSLRTLTHSYIPCLSARKVN